MIPVGNRPWRSLGDSAAVEWTCARELARLARRNSRYLAVILPLYGRTVVLPVRASLMRRCYCLIRMLDDILDGDREWPGDPIETTRKLLADAQAGSFDADDPLRRLARTVFNSLESLQDPRTGPSRHLRDLIETMLFDAERARLHLLLKQDDLSSHLLRTFASALSAALSIAGAKLGPEDLLDLAHAQADLYTLRDLEVDLPRWIVNIPAEVVDQALREGAPAITSRDLFATEAVRQWFALALQRGICHTEKARSILSASHDRRARWVAAPLLRGLGFLARRLRRRSFPVPPTTGPSRLALVGS